tara:strand:+ start:4380 stop:4754 length:375 start_codon:yes stop_codon:yes gene_type:complete
MSTSILDQEYNEQNRPYSQNELHFKRENLFSRFRIGKVRACHKCNHFYFVKENGRKEKEILEYKNEDCGNCSVCWKLNKTPRHLKAKAKSLVDAYCDRFYEFPSFLSYDDSDVEIVFYKWLYEQ